MLKECKLVIHSESIEKCKRLGFVKNPEFNISESAGMYPFLMIQKDLKGSYTYNNFSIHDYVVSILPEISDKEFMLWPEPLKVGDLCLVHDGQYESVVIRVKTINDRGIINHNTDNDGYYKSEDLTKLTPNQIEVLSLNTKDGE